jgi:EpsI family protein
MQVVQDQSISSLATRHPKKMLSNFRIAIVVFLFLFTFWMLQVSQFVKETPIKRSLDEFPKQIGKWTQVNTRLLSGPVAKMLGADDYIDYDYAAPEAPMLNLYISYFGCLDKKGGYHSPRNCLPGSGWDIAHSESLTLDLHRSEPSSAKVNMMIVVKGNKKRLVIYWYQNRGRIISSEYWGKIYLVLDSIFKRRRDGSFIRIMAPAPTGKTGGTAYYLKEFAEQVILILEEFIPGN